MNIHDDSTIVAISTPAGRGAIAMIRVSGKEAISMADKVFSTKARDKDVLKAAGYTVHFGDIIHEGEIIDEVLLTVFRAPHSYSGEDMIEIACHGSTYVQQRIVETLIESGCRVAAPGEFTLRAFMNGRIDLSQAEAVADLIASTSKASHRLALQQMRGGFSQKIEGLRQRLVDFASLIELELDFSDEDVEFADRSQFFALAGEIRHELTQLIESFRLGNVLKHGIPVAIAGKTNVGKSTLLNALLNEERAIVSEIPGTTRDTIEDVITIQGVAFRFIDTAGLRPVTDTIEAIGIQRTREKMEMAAIILYIFDINEITLDELNQTIAELKDTYTQPEKQIILVGNKTDQLFEIPHDFTRLVEHEIIFISAKRKENINLIIDSLLQTVQISDLSSDTLVSNARHLQALQEALKALDAVEEGLRQHLSTDLVSPDLRLALHHLGCITGQVTTEEILGNIFAKFCIGK
ncbi:MAG: tRNA uridine-5-carboxymethylaminomethyl(34) synthesis GTPase MnmE [Bacteroidales bacterium]|nr:tRNA uridine-5-carboxymethylaminomethyl(34) synthesis GTPase MnmE [Bacteroidales bacterium]